MADLPPTLRIDAVVVARNAASTLGEVLIGLPRKQLRSVVVVDCASTDNTSLIAHDHGATILRAAKGGYGAACMRAVAHCAALPQPPDVVLFVSADAVADAQSSNLLLEALGDAELVVGVHRRGFSPRERVIVRLIDTVYRHRFPGLAQTLAIRFPALVALGMSDRGEGWDVELLVRALKLGLTIREVTLEGERSRTAPAGRSLFHIIRHATLR